MRGAAGINLEMGLDGEQVKFSIPTDARSRWELKGRRPVTGIPVPLVAVAQPRGERPRRSNNAPSDEPHPDVAERLSEHYFKWSWRESTRDSEADIIAIAKARAEQYLGEHKGDVLNHLPEVKQVEDYATLSTSHIRAYAGLDTTMSRLPSLMISSRLLEAEEFGGDVWKEKIWEILRCEGTSAFDTRPQSLIRFL